MPVGHNESQADDSTQNTIMTEEDYYNLLLYSDYSSRTVRTPKESKKIFNQLARKLHSDKTAASDDEMQLLNAAADKVLPNRVRSSGTISNDANNASTSYQEPTYPDSSRFYQNKPQPPKPKPKLSAEDYYQQGLKRIKKNKAKLAYVSFKHAAKMGHCTAFELLKNVAKSYLEPEFKIPAMEALADVYAHPGEFYDLKLAYELYRKLASEGRFEVIDKIYSIELLEISRITRLSQLKEKLNNNLYDQLFSELTASNKIKPTWKNIIKRYWFEINFALVKLFGALGAYSQERLNTEELLKLMQPILSKLINRNPDILKHEDLKPLVCILKAQTSLSFELSIQLLREGFSIQNVLSFWSTEDKDSFSACCLNKFKSSTAKGKDALSPILQLAMEKPNKKTIEILFNHGATFPLRLYRSLSDACKEVIENVIKGNERAQRQVIQSISSAADIQIAQGLLRGLKYDLAKTENKQLALYDAIQQQYTDAIKFLLQQGISLTQRLPGTNNSALNLLFNPSNPKAKDIFIQSPQILTALSPNDRSALLQAAVENDALELVKAISRAFPNEAKLTLEQFDWFDDALIKGMPMADYLLSISHIDKLVGVSQAVLQTLLKSALQQDLANLCALLLNSGAKCDVINEYNKTLLSYALEERRYRVLQVFIASGATAINSKQTYLDYLLNSDLKIKHPLEYEKLLQSIKRVLAQFKLAQIALLSAISSHAGLALAEELLSGAEYDLNKDINKEGVLYSALIYQRAEFARHLIELGFTLASFLKGLDEANRQRILLFSVEQNFSSIIKDILDKFPNDAKLTTADGLSLTDVAYKKGFIELENDLIRRGAPCSAKRVAAEDSIQNLDKLLGNKHYAYKYGNLLTVKSLFEAQLKQKKPVKEQQALFEALQNKLDYFNQHRNPTWDGFWGKKYTMSWQETWKEIRQNALNELMQEVNGLATNQAKLQHLEWAREQSLFNLHRSNWGWGRTSAVQAIDAKIEEIRQLENPESCCCW